ncbi:16S rRNA (guanine(966)-N(2))-methyltransferase RsmD [Legionella sainthelensi]|uniref:16S rRNA (guanine(966)-N(2))-methyltransferase RsmD n=1 Tax=Legionella sainthelensi TaxID=28087 RepID=UPI000E200DD0|nr:16S rRNA (guanine(966)-N(2))-methyltransferase RsmD [Legionella sainthelensi]
MKQSVRIIGGLYRGKKLYVPDEEGLRPTPDRVRETLFNWLMHDIREARCLDAFAGSGALGLEAFSRGAGRVVFLEQSTKAFTNLKKVIDAFNSPKLKLLRADALSYLKQNQEEFDLIFLDPPFAKDYLPQCLADITHSQIIKTGGLVYLESAAAIHLDDRYWRQVKLKQAGQVAYGLFEKL